MTRVELWFFRRLAAREVVQGFDHDTRIAGMYSVITKAARREFNEDNKPTLDCFLTELHKESLG